MQEEPSNFSHDKLCVEGDKCIRPLELGWVILPGVGIIYLEDHPMTCKCLITMISKSPKWGSMDCRVGVH